MEFCDPEPLGALSFLSRKRKRDAHEDEAIATDWNMDVDSDTEAAESSRSVENPFRKPTAITRKSLVRDVSAMCEDDDDEDTEDFRMTKGVSYEAGLVFDELSAWKSMPDADEPLWDSEMDDVAERIATMELMDKESQCIRSAYDVLSDPAYGRRLAHGDVILDNIEHSLENFSMKRSAAQVEYHNAFIQAILPICFGHAWEANADRVLRDRSLSKVKPDVFISAPRRHGKTVSISQFAASVGAHLTGKSIGIISTNLRTSVALKQKILKFIKEIPGAEERICKDTKQNIFVAKDPMPPGVSLKSPYAQRIANEDSTTKVYALPSGVDGMYWFALCRPKGNAGRESVLCACLCHAVHGRTGIVRVEVPISSDVLVLVKRLDIRGGLVFQRSQPYIRAGTRQRKHQQVNRFCWPLIAGSAPDPLFVCRSRLKGDVSKGDQQPSCHAKVPGLSHRHQNGA